MADDHNSAHELTRELGAVVAGVAADCAAPTVVWGVRQDGRWLAEGCSATDGRPWPQPRAQVYRIASMTKSFTAATVLALRDDGLLRLDDVAADIAPELGGVTHPDADAGPITVRRLLSMTSGLATDDAWADRHLDISDGELDDLYAGGLGFAARPGTVFEYSNVGYSMLGRVIRAVTGRRPQAVTTERVLTPLGMRDTGWDVPPGRWAPPFRTVDGTAVPDDDPLGDGGIAPMGGLWSTIDDLGIWTDFLAGAWSIPPAGESAVLRAASRREMQHPHTYCSVSTEWGPASDGGPVRTRTVVDGYGFGLRVDHDSRHGRVVHHTGGLPGYGSNMRWLPGRGTAVIALANVTYAPMERLTGLLVDRLADLGALPPIDPCADAAPELRAAAGHLIDLINRWDDASAAQLFADNVALDESFDRRRAAAERLVSGHGKLTLEDVRAERALRGTVRASSADGAAWSVVLEMSPQRPPRIQLYEISQEGPA